MGVTKCKVEVIWLVVAYYFHQKDYWQNQQQNIHLFDKTCTNTIAGQH